MILFKLITIFVGHFYKHESSNGGVSKYPETVLVPSLLSTVGALILVLEATLRIVLANDDYDDAPSPL